MRSVKIKLLVAHFIIIFLFFTCSPINSPHQALTHYFLQKKKIKIDNEVCIRKIEEFIANNTSWKILSMNCTNRNTACIADVKICEPNVKELLNEIIKKSLTNIKIGDFSSLKRVLCNKIALFLDKHRLKIKKELQVTCKVEKFYLKRMNNRWIIYQKNKYKRRNGE